MRRRILNTLCAISFVLCLAAAGAWVASHWRSEQIFTESGSVWRGMWVEALHEVDSNRGGLTYVHKHRHWPLRETQIAQLKEERTDTYRRNRWLTDRAYFTSWGPL